jgi:hypothetical protein
LDSNFRNDPDESLGVFVVMGEIFVDCRFEFLHFGEDTPTQPLAGDGTKEVLNHVQPRG